MRQEFAFQKNADMQFPHPNHADTAIRFHKNAVNKNLAASYVDKGNVFAHQDDIKQAVKYYHEALKEMPESIPALYNLGSLMYDMGDIDQAVRLYEQTIKLNPNFPEGFYGLGKAIKKKGEIGESIKCLQKALNLRPNFSEARRALDHTCRTVVPRWHFAMMNDSDRNQTYEMAIKEAVKKDSVVLDIGTGSGLLAMFAAKASARKVISCERNAPIAEIAKEIVKRNGLSEIITVVNKDSKDLVIGHDLPDKANLLISEIFDVGLIGEGVIPTINDAFSRLLVPNGVCLPQRAKIYGALFESQKLFDHGRVSTVSGFDLGEFNTFSSSGYFQAQLSQFPHRLISNVFEAFSFDFNNEPSLSEKRKIPLKIAENAVCHGVVFWFKLFLTDDIHLDIGPKTDSHWKQAVQLLTPAVSLKKDQEVVALAKHDCNEVSFDLGIPFKKNRQKMH